ncbi:hypothetical protein [Specibacter sp. NPDC078692]|uniref:hypothetical protein n=1 Tax=Specibacter sp. NPDC078692 TaxID=3155818 RepID=UPI00341A6625
MNGTILDDIEDTGALADSVEAELLALRGSHGILTVQKFQTTNALRRVCGGGDLLDAFLMFEREIHRYTRYGSREEAAAAISIAAKAETVLDRMEHVVGALPQDGRIRDQRTGRRWSDEGIRIIARDLTHLAEVQGRLGTELLTLELGGTLEGGLRLDIYQLTTKTLADTAPLVRIWRYRDDELEEATSQIEFDFEQISLTPVASDKHKLNHYTLKLHLPDDILTVDIDPDDPVYSISIEGRDAPMRTVTFSDQSMLGPMLRTRFTIYRTIGSIEVVRTSHDQAQAIGSLAQ